MTPEGDPQSSFTPEMESYILQRAGEVIPLKHHLRHLAAVNGITDTDVFDAFLPKVHGTGLGGDPEALLHALGGPVA